jgi:hypothetical protein
MDELRKYGGVATGYLHDLRRGTPEARPSKFERDESGKLLIPEGADPHRYQELQRAQEGAPLGRDPETGDVVRSPEWAGLQSKGFARSSDPGQRVEQGPPVTSRDPSDPAVREGFYEALRKRFPDKAPSSQEQARVAAKYLAGNESTRTVDPELVDALLNFDQTGKRKPKKKQLTPRELDMATRKETML